MVAFLYIFMELKRGTCPMVPPRDSLKQQRGIQYEKLRRSRMDYHRSGNIPNTKSQSSKIYSEHSHILYVTRFSLCIHRKSLYTLGFPYTKMGYFNLSYSDRCKPAQCLEH